jgi:hypothetical protein
VYAAFATEHQPSRWAATDPIGEVDILQPVRPQIQRPPYQNFQQGKRRPLNKKPNDKGPRKPSDPEHKIDDYA